MSNIFTRKYSFWQIVFGTIFFFFILPKKLFWWGVAACVGAFTATVMSNYKEREMYRRMDNDYHRHFIPPHRD